MKKIRQSKKIMPVNKKEFMSIDGYCEALQVKKEHRKIVKEILLAKNENEMMVAMISLTAVNLNAAKNLFEILKDTSRIAKIMFNEAVNEKNIEEAINKKLFLDSSVKQNIKIFWLESLVGQPIINNELRKKVLKEVMEYYLLETKNEMKDLALNALQSIILTKEDLEYIIKAALAVNKEEHLSTEEKQSLQELIRFLRKQIESKASV